MAPQRPVAPQGPSSARVHRRSTWSSAVRVSVRSKWGFLESASTLGCACLHALTLTGPSTRRPEKEVWSAVCETVINQPPSSRTSSLAYFRSATRPADDPKWSARLLLTRLSDRFSGVLASHLSRLNLTLASRLRSTLLPWSTRPALVYLSLVYFDRVRRPDAALERCSGRRHLWSKSSLPLGHLGGWDEWRGA